MLGSLELQHSTSNKSLIQHHILLLSDFESWFSDFRGRFSRLRRENEGSVFWIFGFEFLVFLFCKRISQLAFPSSRFSFQFGNSYLSEKIPEDRSFYLFHFLRSSDAGSQKSYPGKLETIDRLIQDLNFNYPFPLSHH